MLPDRGPLQSGERMAHIVELKIDGLLGRKESVHLKLNRNVNVIFGENGCGKTTLLKVLDAALSLDGSALERLPVRRAEVHIFSISTDQILKHVWDRDSAEKTSKLPANLPTRTLNVADSANMQLYLELMHRSPKRNWKITPTPEDEPKRWAHTFLQTTRLYSDLLARRQLDSAVTLSEQELDQAFAESTNRAWLEFYSKTLKEVTRIQEDGLRAVLHHVISPQHDKPTPKSSNVADVYQRVANFLSRQQGASALTLGSPRSFVKRYESEAELRRVVDNLYAVEGDIEVAMIPVERFKWTIDKLFSRGKSLLTSRTGLQFQAQDGTNLSIANLSSGEKHLVKILVAAMSSEENSVLIDEPELSMHIDWQRVLVHTIQSMNPECQLILASHSPEVMADVPDSCIFRI